MDVWDDTVIGDDEDEDAFVEGWEEIKNASAVDPRPQVTRDADGKLVFDESLLDTPSHELAFLREILNEN